MKYNYKCVVAKNGKRYYKNVSGKWKRITNKVGEKAEKGKRKYRLDDEEYRKLNNRLYRSIRNNNIPKMYKLLDRGAQINSSNNSFGYTPLYTAAWLGQRDIVMALLSRGANPNERTANNGRTAEEAAREQKHPGIEMLLITKR